MDLNCVLRSWQFDKIQNRWQNWQNRLQSYSMSSKPVCFKNQIAANLRNIEVLLSLLGTNAPYNRSRTLKWYSYEYLFSSPDSSLLLHSVVPISLLISIFLRAHDMGLFKQILKKKQCLLSRTWQSINKAT
jgi:hypothetical protein